MEFRDRIGDWSAADLRRFVVNLMLSDPGALPKEVSGPTQRLPSPASDGNVPVWDAATNSWVTSGTHKVGYGELTLTGSVVDADINSVAPSKLTGYPADISKVLLGDGSWAGGIRKFYDSTLGGSAANFDVTSIPATGAHLLIVVYGRSDVVATGTTVAVRPNNDSTAIYYGELMSAGGATQIDQDATATTSARIGRIPAANAPVNGFGATFALIPNYTGSGSKPILGWGFSSGAHSAGSNNTVESNGFEWYSSAVISRLVVFPGGGNFIAASRCTVHIIG